MKKLIGLLLVTLVSANTNSGIKPYKHLNKYDTAYIKNDVYLNKEPKKPVIIDLDMAGDIDDVCAFRIADGLDDEGQIDLKMVALSVNGGDKIIKATDGMLTHDKMKDVIIGKCSHQYSEPSTYWDTMSECYSGNYEVIDAVKGYRKILAESNRRVDIVTTGYTFNIEGLIKSKPDKYSKLSGIELIKKKVGQLYITGGSYPNGYHNNFAYFKYASESAKFVNDNWPLPIIYFLNNQANRLICGKGLQDIDKNKYDVVNRAMSVWGTDKGRAAWDPYAVWCTAYGLGDICKSSIEKASTEIDGNTGYNRFTVDEKGKNYIVFMNPDIPNSYYNDQLDDILVRKYHRLYG